MSDVERVENANGTVTYLITSDYGKGTLAFDPVELLSLDMLLNMWRRTSWADALQQVEQDADAYQRVRQAHDASWQKWVKRRGHIDTNIGGYIPEDF